jgi:hypothetical protein
VKAVIIIITRINGIYSRICIDRVHGVVNETIEKDGQYSIKFKGWK